MNKTVSVFIVKHLREVLLMYLLFLREVLESITLHFVELLIYSIYIKSRTKCGGIDQSTSINTSINTALFMHMCKVTEMVCDL